MDEEKEDQSISINDLEYLPITRNVKESLRVQRTEYIRQQMRNRQEHEDALMEQLLQEQRVIDGLQKKIDENLEQTAESSKYNREFKESMNAQIYALHGVSEDKMEGMREYKNAYYQGSAFSLFLLSAAMIVLCGILHGFQSDICVFMLAYTGIEGALLAQEKKRWKLWDMLCKLLYLLMFPVMMVMFVCYELQYPEYHIFLPYVTMAGIGILLLATVSYFLYNPYRSVKKKVRDAKGHIEDIERIARKEVRKNQKSRQKDEKRAYKQSRKEDRMQERSIRKEQRHRSRGVFFQKLGAKAGSIASFGRRGEENAELEITEAEDDAASDNEQAEPENKTAEAITESEC